MKRQTKMHRARVQRMIAGRRSGDVFINRTTDGRLWASNSYWLVEADALTELFAWWNLTVDVGSYRVDGRVGPTVLTPPDMDALLEVPNKRVTVEAETVGSGKPLFFKDPGTKAEIVVFRRCDNDGQRFGLNAQYLDFVAPGWRLGVVTLEQDVASVKAPVIRLDGGRVKALLMPVSVT